MPSICDKDTPLALGDVNDIGASGPAIPPPSSIQLLQNIGVRLCGVPAEDLSPRKLLARLQEDDVEDSTS